MISLRMPGRRAWFVTLALTLATLALSTWLRSVAEQTLRERIDATARRQGMVARIDTVRVGLWPLLRLQGLDVALKPGLRLQADSVVVTWPFGWRVAVQGANLRGPADLELRSASSRWQVEGLGSNDLRLTLRDAEGDLTLQRQATAAEEVWQVKVEDLDLGSLLQVRHEGLPVFVGGRADGHGSFRRSTAADRWQVDLGLRGTHLVSQAGAPTDLTVSFDANHQRAAGTLEVPALRATAAGAVLAGSLGVKDLDTDPVMDLALELTQLDFARLLETAGLAMPERLQRAGAGRPPLGVAALHVDVEGRLAEPASLVVTQKIRFTPPRDVPAAITALRGDFHFRPTEGGGTGRSIHVSPESPDFIAIDEVPPLFIRALTLAEDTDFYGHRGIDLREMPMALATNWSRGTAARGGSTISQQLAKNLFLSRDKQVGRKLQEVPIAFLLESTLGKQRILEIYLNIIEWGPGLRGLRPAARHYFGREPAALTPAEMAFLVSIIPGPILYQRSFAGGTPGPGLRAMVNTLLAKLRSVDALTEEQYRLALEEPLLIGAGRPEG